MLEDLTPQAGTEQVAATVTPTEETVKTPEVTPEQPTPEPAPQAEPVVEQKPELPPLEERYRNQRSEALILNAQVKAKDELLTKLTSQDAPTEQEILSEYPVYGQMDDTSKKFIVNLMTSNKRQARLDRQLAEAEADRKWRSELDNLSQETQYSALAGDKDFERFVFSPKHKGLDIKVLADAFLLRTGKTPLEDTPRTVQKQPAMPTSTNRTQAPRKSNKVSLEEARILRQTNSKEYLRLVKAGMIDDDI